jgi:hypothetical protein
MTSSFIIAALMPLTLCAGELTAFPAVWYWPLARQSETSAVNPGVFIFLSPFID